MIKKSCLLMLVVMMLLGLVANAQASLFVRRPNTKNPVKPALCFEQEHHRAKIRVKGNSATICFNMENIDTSAMIDAFDVEIYCTDVYESIIFPSNCEGDDYKMTYTIKKKIKAGKTGYSSYCKISDCEGIAYIHAAVTKYHYKKGSEPCASCIEPDDTNTVVLPDYSLDWITWDVY